MRTGTFYPLGPRPRVQVALGEQTASYNRIAMSRFRPTTTVVRLVMGILAAIGLSVLCLGAKQFVMPAAQPAKTYPARDEHSDEAVTLALDPYDMADKAN